MAEDPKPEPIDVLFAGQTGIGKSTLINMIRNVTDPKEGAAKVSNDACPCTIETTFYPVNLKGSEYRLWDMRGLDEAVGSDDGWAMTKKLAEKIRRRINQQQRQLEKELRDRTTGVATPILVWCIDATKVSVPIQYQRFQQAYAEYCNKNTIPVIVLTQMSPDDTEWRERCSEQLAKLKLGTKGSGVDVRIERVRRYRDASSTQYKEDAESLRNLICEPGRRKRFKFSKFKLEGEHIDVIEELSSMLPCWDPLIEIKVGDYGVIGKDSGNFVEEGNIYDPEFQEELNKRGFRINMADYSLEEGLDEDDIIFSSSGVNCKDISIEFNPRAPFKGRWSIEGDKTEVIFYMHRPRLTSLPEGEILRTLYQVKTGILHNKWLVTSTYTCPAYFIYLPGKGTDNVSATLASESPTSGAIDSNGRLIWSVDAESGVCHKASDPAGKHSFTPLFSMKRPISQFSVGDCSEPL